ncbi:MAG: DUF1667 domain-containing protein [Firmicutes bacterium]|nr:DUF1667 domain-containing protein [Bacillota bacterium]
MEKDLVCIVCPIGCRLKITGSIEKMVVSGGKCTKAIGYAHDELTNPTRMICTTARIKGGIHKVIPVKTDKPIRDEFKFDVVEEVNKLNLVSPVKMGDIVIANVCGTDVNIVAERDM